jgi:hypothetical protein
MPVSADWDNEAHTVVRVQIHDPWDTQQYSQATLQAWSLIESVDHTVDLIIDFTDAYSFPKSILSQASITNIHIHPRQGLVIGVKISPYLQAVIKTTIRVFPRLGHKLCFVQTVQDAYELIQKQTIKPQ